MPSEMKVAVVTGTSTGIGLATSLHLARNGYRVFAGIRNLAKSGPLTEIVARDDLPLTTVQMDVTDQSSTDGAFAKARQAGPIDVLVNNAGIGGATPLELTPEDEHRAIFETNYFGSIRCIQAVLPEMRERRSGTIVNVSSIVGMLAMPNQIPYSATKWAIECAGEALAHEVYRFGVRVVNVQPGVIMTDIFDNSAPATRYDKQSPYQPIMRRNGKMYGAGFKANEQPQRVAETILEAIESPTYQLRWPVGRDAWGISQGRPRISDEDWVSMGDDLSDEEYNGRYRDYFGVDL